MSRGALQQPHSQADGLRARFKVPEWGVFCHMARLRNYPAQLKLALSDSTHFGLQDLAEEFFGP